MEKMPELDAGQKEKDVAATSSMVAALGLTAVKIVVGVSTGSLGILAEAAHSGLDLLAAVMTVFAVRMSGRPADRCHLYGHGKVENVSALFETMLLLFTCGWIVWTAVTRLLKGQVEIEVNAWSFGVMGLSIAVDISRSRLLYRAAKKHRSQALEADALHFSTDIWSSAVVLLGLFCVQLSEWLKGYEFLHYADTVAAIVVGLVVVGVSIRLGKRAVSELVDAAPVGIEPRVLEIVRALPGALDCHQVRVRSSGPQLFIDLHMLVDGERTLRDAHRLTEDAEVAIRRAFPNADVTVHPEPIESGAASAPDGGGL